jgi:hypothetical protein
MRQLSCMSADVYCQKLNNQSYVATSYLYSNGKKGKQARCQRDRERERESVCARQRVAENRVGIRCKNGRWGATK